MKYILNFSFIELRLTITNTSSENLIFFHKENCNSTLRAATKATSHLTSFHFSDNLPCSSNFYETSQEVQPRNGLDDNNSFPKMRHRNSGANASGRNVCTEQVFRIVIIRAIHFENAWLRRHGRHLHVIKDRKIFLQFNLIH